MFAIKSVSELGIYRYVRSDRACNLLWRKYITLPLIPPAEIPSRLRELRKCINTNLPTYARRGFRKYHLYVKRFWVKKVRPERFSVFGRRRRTNNGVESMHAVFSRHLVRHGNVFKLILGLETHVWSPCLVKVNQIKAGTATMPAQKRRQRTRER